MKKQFISQIVAGFFFTALQLFLFLPRWYTALIDKNTFFMYIYFLLTIISFLFMAFAHGFRFRFLRNRILKKRINSGGIVGYLFLLYLFLKKNSLDLVFSASKVMGVLYVLLLILIVIAPLYMESEKEKSDKTAS